VWPAAAGYRFSVWAPTRRGVDLVFFPSSGSERRIPLAPEPDGCFGVTLAEARPGDRYAYLLDGEGPFPDPCSRYQPDGVHGASELIDPSAFAWSDRGWRGVALRDAVLYELHVGTFSPQGTFAGVTDRLPYLADLGISVLELMPVADFPGRWNWGYDGVSLFAPARCYGRPDDLRRLVDTAHGLGLAVILDVVYNHFGPDGAYQAVFSPYYLSAQHRTPWGAAVNLDGDHSAAVRAFFIRNALQWLTEYHLDGLRLDATHGFVDETPSHLIRDLTLHAREVIRDRTLLLMAEDERNLDTAIRPASEGGWGLDAVWSDDFHHQVRRLTAGDRDGYYQDFSGSVADLAATIEKGWFYCGQHSTYLDRPRGTDPARLPVSRMVFCIQNHDQVGNRAFGTRLTHDVDAATFRALAALLLFLPETPLLFMGQEWAATSPFLYFTDHNPDLGRLVTEGRRREFSRFAAFADEATRTAIPDPQAESTFAASRLDWSELERPAHRAMRDLYRAMLALRRGDRAFEAGDVMAWPLGDQGLAVRRIGGSDHPLLLLACLRGSAIVDARSWPAVSPGDGWHPALTTEDHRFVEANDRAAGGEGLWHPNGAAVVEFRRPGAAILRKD